MAWAKERLLVNGYAGRDVALDTAYRSGGGPILTLEVGPALMGMGGLLAVTERHHELPKEFRAYFEEVGLDIDAPEFIRELSPAAHRLKPDGLHTGSANWNKLWRDFIKENPTPDKAAILEYLQWMRGTKYPQE